MARRRLEAALQVGKAIEKGISSDPSQLPEKITVKHIYEFEDFRTGIYSLQYSPDAEFLVVGFGDGSIQVLSTKSGSLLKELRKHKLTGLPITCIRFHPKDPQAFMATSAEGQINMFNATEGVLRDTIAEDHNEINCLDFSMDGDFYGTGGKDKHVRVYDVNTNKVIRSYEGYDINSASQNENSHAHRIFALKFHPDHNNMFITGGWDNHLKCWDMRSKDPVKRFINGPHICGDSVDVKGPYILTGSWVANDALQVWDFGTGRLVQSVPLQDKENTGDFIYCAQFAEKTLAFAGGSGTNSVQVVNLKTEKVLGDVPLSHPVQAMDSIGRQFALAGACQQLKMAMIH